MLEILMAIVAVIGVIVAFWEVTNSRKSSLDKERFTTIIGPSFEILEPYLYCDISKFEVLNAYHRVADIMHNNKLFAGYKFSQYNRLEITQKEYLQFCKLLDCEYDRLCRLLRLPVRDFFYRVNHQQKTSAWRWVIYVGFHLGVFVLSMLSFLILFVLIASKIGLFLESASLLQKTVTYFLLFILSMLFLKLMDKLYS